jgi:predicted transposase/invertase (TIGR01784 family)
MAPFYPMKYEQVFTGNHSEELEKQCYDEVTQLTNKITKKVEDGEINKQVYDLSLSGMEQVMQYIQSKAEILNKEGFDMVMQNIQQRKYVLDQLNWRDEGRQEGRQEGMRREKLETAREMKQDNVPIEKIQKYTRLPIEEIQAL